MAKDALLANVLIAQSRFWRCELYICGCICANRAASPLAGALAHMGRSTNKADMGRQIRTDTRQRRPSMPSHIIIAIYLPSTQPSATSSGNGWDRVLWSSVWTVRRLKFRVWSSQSNHIAKIILESDILVEDPTGLSLFTGLPRSTVLLERLVSSGV